MRKIAKITTKAITLILAVLVVGYIVFCLLAYLFPQLFYYAPSPSSSNLEFALSEGYQAEKVFYESADGTPLLAWYTKPAPGRPVILFFHGNAGKIEFFYHKLQPLTERGYGAFMAEYRGFGGLKGTIRQKNLNADAAAALEYLYRLGYKNSDIIIYGLSMGSHMALNTADSFQDRGAFRAVLLEVPFDSLLNVVKTIVPVPMPFDLVVRDYYDNVPLVKRLKSPLLVMGGKEDELVPVERAKNLFMQAHEPKKLIVYPLAGHNSLFDHKNYIDIMKWLERYEKA